ncbi:hypothetical protein BH24DEI2_BH24DEI2_27260 [soil metagenome]
MNNLAKPLQSLRELTAGLRADLEKQVRRVSMRHGGLLILADVSASMAERVGADATSLNGACSKHELLKEVLANVLRPGDGLIAFAGKPLRLATAADLPAPLGGTALELALSEAVVSQPSVTLVISDGQPRHAEAALTEAGKLKGIVNVVYCGPDDDAEALAFMHRLAAQGGGRCWVYDLRREAARAQLEAGIRGALGKG